MIEWRLFKVKQHKYKLVLGWGPSGGLFFLYDTKRHVMTTISIKSLRLEGIHSNYVSSGLFKRLTSGHNLVFPRLLLSYQVGLVSEYFS